MILMGGPNDPDVSLESQAECGRLHSDLVSELQTLLEARSRPYSADVLLAGVDLVVEDRDRVVRNAAFYLGADRELLEARIDPATENPPMLISFSLAVCERLPRLRVDHDNDTGTMSIEVVPQEHSACDESPRTATVQLNLKSDIEIRTVKTQVG